MAGGASFSSFATTGVTPTVAVVGCTGAARSGCAVASACVVTFSRRAATGWDAVIAVTGTTVAARRFTMLFTLLILVTVLILVTFVTLLTLTAFT